MRLFLVLALYLITGCTSTQHAAKANVQKTKTLSTERVSMTLMEGEHEGSKTCERLLKQLKKKIPSILAAYDCHSFHEDCVDPNSPECYDDLVIHISFQKKMRIERHERRFQEFEDCGEWLAEMEREHNRNFLLGTFYQKDRPVQKKGKVETGCQVFTLDPSGEGNEKSDSAPAP